MTKLLIILLLASFTSQAQLNPKDTMCFKVETIQKLLIDAKQKRLSDSLVTLYRENIAAYEIIVREYKSKDSVNQEIVKIYVDRVTLLEKEVKKWRRKTRWTAIAGAVAVGATIFLIKN